MGFGLLWAWMFMMFYSIVPYAHAADVRSTLYASLFFSLAAMVCTLLFASFAVRKGDRLGASSMVLAGAAAAMTAGTVLTMVSETGSPNGMLALAFGSILTGSGSAVMLLCWTERLAAEGGRVALAEAALASCVAFLLGFCLVMVPPAAACVGIAVMPAASVAVFRRCTAAEYARAGGGAGAAAAGGAGSSRSREPLSRQTVALFAKALAGVALVGFIAGFFDVVSGFNAYEVQDVYGVYLFLAGLLGVLALAVIALLFSRDSVYFSYRVSMLLVCVGCLLTPFLGDNNTYWSAFVFGGYHCYGLVLLAVCVDVSYGFRVSALRAIGLGTVVLYAGEELGALTAHSLGPAGVAALDLALVTLVAVAVLLISHLFLFTETDLVKLGIGDMGPMSAEGAPGRALAGGAPAAAGAAAAGEAGEAPTFRGCAEVAALASAVEAGARAQRAAAADPCEAMVKRFGLSPRESDVLPLLLEGRTISRIQDALYISAGTVSTHIRHIYQKTGVDNRQGLIDLAQEIADEAAAHAAEAGPDVLAEAARALRADGFPDGFPQNDMK